MSASMGYSDCGTLVEAVTTAPDIESGVDAQQLAEARQDQSRAAQQYEGQPDLRHHQDLAHAARPRPPVPERLSSRSTSLTGTRITCNDGISPMTMPTSAAVTSIVSTTMPSTRTSPARGSVSIPLCAKHAAIRRPSRPQPRHRPGPQGCSPSPIGPPDVPPRRLVPDESRTLCAAGWLALVAGSPHSRRRSAARTRPHPRAGRAHLGPRFTSMSSSGMTTVWKPVLTRISL